MGRRRRPPAAPRQIGPALQPHVACSLLFQQAHLRPRGVRLSIGPGPRGPAVPRPSPPPPLLRSQREAEVVSLKHQLAERDGKLKAARTDALEARMALQQKDAELKAAFAQLSEAVHERSVMRTQLAQVGTCPPHLDIPCKQGAIPVSACRVFAPGP